MIIIIILYIIFFFFVNRCVIKRDIKQKAYDIDNKQSIYE